MTRRLVLAQAPAVLLNTIRAPKPSTGTSGGSNDEPILEGDRNTKLFAKASQLRRRNHDDRLVVEASVRAYNAVFCKPPLDQAEVRTIIESAFRQDHTDDFPDYDPDRAVTADARKTRVVAGDEFVLDEPTEVTAVVGSGEQVLWAAGEGCMLNGQQGVGKTTVAQQIVLHGIGVRTGPLFGLPVATFAGPVVYLAMDRPRQAARSFRRMVSPEDRELLRHRLVVWKGPLPTNPTKSPTVLADFVQEICPTAAVLVVDSVKDLAPGISADEVGAALNMAWQEVVARDIELLVLHHERKASQGSARAHSIDDVYGSVWLTAGMGSVLVLEGEPGDPSVTLRHLKQPAEPVGPLDLRHDHATGTTRLHKAPSLLDVLHTSGPSGMTAEEIALVVIGRSSRNDVRSIKHRLDKQVKTNAVELISGAMTPAGRQPNRYRLTGLAEWIGGL